MRAKFRKHLKAKECVWNFIVMTLIPIFITLFQTAIPDAYVNESIRYIITFVVAATDFFLIVWLYRKDLKKKDILLVVKTKSAAYSNAYQLSERKRNEIAKKTYTPDDTTEYHIPKDAIPYDVHDHIAEICMNFRDTISQITAINQEHMAVTFIYHYDYNGANEEDRSWRWIVGKEASTRTRLDKFVERESSLYNYLVKGNDGRVNSVFNNDKKDLAYEGHYYMSPRDNAHNRIGSVFATKVFFGNNAENFVEGILLVSSYGKQFVDKGSEYTENGLKNLILEELYPYYQRLLETELGFLYLRHEKKKSTNKKCCDSECCCRRDFFCKDEAVQ